MTHLRDRMAVSLTADADALALFEVLQQGGSTLRAVADTAVLVYRLRECVPRSALADAKEAARLVIAAIEAYEAGRRE